MGLEMYLETNSKTLIDRLGIGETYGYLASYCRRWGIAVYWQWTNCVHRWFVENVQGGNDDCRTYEVEVEQLMELRDTCERVCEDHNLAMELLPPKDGLSFGSTELDEWYWIDVKRTYEELDEILGKIDFIADEFLKTRMIPVVPDDPSWVVKFYYRSSW